jgi:hypothetical protein
LGVEYLDRDIPLQPGIMSAIHFAHAAFTDGRKDFIRAEFCHRQTAASGEGSRLQPKSSVTEKGITGDFSVRHRQTGDHNIRIVREVQTKRLVS